MKLEQPSLHLPQLRFSMPMQSEKGSSKKHQKNLIARIKLQLLNKDDCKQTNDKPFQGHEDFD